MIQQTPSWKTSDGAIHTSYLSGLKHEIKLWFSKAGGDAVGAKNIVNALDEEAIDHLLEILTAIKKETKTPSTFQVVKVESDTLLLPMP